MKSVIEEEIAALRKRLDVLEGPLCASPKQVIAVIEAQHRAIDALMARLATADRSFRPSQSGEIWEAVIDGHDLIHLLKKEKQNDH